MPVRIPPPPYWAVIFSSQLRSDEPRYAEMADRMVRLAQTQPGFLGVESSHRDEHGNGITVSYWESVEAIAAGASTPNIWWRNSLAVRSGTSLFRCAWPMSSGLMIFPGMTRHEPGQG
ncbi:antibiotic biosynthesis monooxygenase family protein [Paludibacterium denitrificans]|uniref:antibiotic biosynthesis monooxygenase family protein n=1 Tax=Paludibacterium denitrificans TaxID=2675226 RepID=UPI001E4BB015|nr:antibiotic biosynthesis monooxygenase [Paludibacterium denitrificans]